MIKKLVIKKRNIQVIQNNSYIQMIFFELKNLGIYKKMRKYIEIVL